MRILPFVIAGTGSLLLLLAAVPVSAEEAGPEAPALRFNPFLLPDVEALMRQRDAGTGTPDEPAAAAWEPTLRATLVDGEHSLANLGGVILRPSEETHGYRLLEVREWEAVFEHEGEALVLPLESPEGDES